MRPEMSTSIARTLADWMLQTPLTDIPGSAWAAGEKMLLDTCACAYCGREAPGIPEVVALERTLGASGPAHVFFQDGALALPSAAYCNAAMIHALDYDNNYSAADLHILSIVVPVALACGEAVCADGERTLAAIIMGVEAAARIAKPYKRARRTHDYFLTTSLAGGWGGVAAAACLMGINADQFVDAMGVYYAHTCGNRQALLERALTKRIQPAIAAKAAVYAVLLAQRGFTGPERLFEGPGGFYPCYTLDPPPPVEAFATRGCRSIEELSVKRFPTCGVHHANIASALHLRRHHAFSADDVERVDFFLNEGGGTLVSMPYEPGRVPQIDAQFCAPYAIALALDKGAVSVRDFTPRRISQNRATDRLARRTCEQIHFSDLGLRDYDAPLPDFKYTKVTLRDGRVLEHGCASRPLNDPEATTLDDVRGKFRECAGMHGDVDAAAVERRMARILAIRRETAVSGWVEATLGTPLPPAVGKGRE